MTSTSLSLFCLLLTLGQHFTRSACEPCARHTKYLVLMAGPGSP